MMKRILRWFGKKRNPIMDSPDMMENLINKLAITEEHEISCDEVHEILDQFSEMKLRGENVSQLMPLMQKHLDLCPDCMEEHVALMQALEFERRID